MRFFLVIGCLLLVIAVVVSCQNEQQVDYSRYYSAGAEVYQSHCQNCHGDKGQGLAALIPPLTDGAFLGANKSNLPCYIRNGLKGNIQVNKREFEGLMPAVTLTNIEIAQVLTFISNSFGSKMGLINNDDVERDLKNCK